MSEKSSEDMIDWMGQTVHRAYHDRYPDFWTCPKDVCASAAQHLREREALVVAGDSERPRHKVARSVVENARESLSNVVEELYQLGVLGTREANMDLLLGQLDSASTNIERARRYCENVKAEREER